MGYAQSCLRPLELRSETRVSTKTPRAGLRRVLSGREAAAEKRLRDTAEPVVYLPIGTRERR